MGSDQKVHSRSIFISDTHLLSRDSQPEVLYRFLDHIECDHLFLVGDIVDLWYSRKNLYWPPIYNLILRKILKRAARGAAVTYLPGNHDELFRKIRGYSLGNIRVLEKTIHETADGRRLLVIHGDQFDAVVTHHPWLSHLGTGAYTTLIQLNRFVNWVRRLKGLPYKSISGAIKRRVKQAVKYINRFEETLVAAAVREKVDGVVCGHIHMPANKDVDGIQYINCGDFVENCTAVVEHADGRLEVLDVLAFNAQFEDSQDPIGRQNLLPGDMEGLEETWPASEEDLAAVVSAER